MAERVMEVSEVGRTCRHTCSLCSDFHVDEPPELMETVWGDNGTVTLKLTRAMWELPMVSHWFEDHPEHFQLVFPGVVLISDALLAVAARAEQSLNDQVRRVLRPASERF